MNKYVLTCQVSRKLNLPVREVALVINALFECMASSLLDGQKVTIASFGSFRLRDSRERKAYDPYRREHILVPAGKSVRFTTSPALQNGSICVASRMWLAKIAILSSAYRLHQESSFFIK